MSRSDAQASSFPAAQQRGPLAPPRRKGVNLNTRSEMPVLEARSLVPPQPPALEWGWGWGIPKVGWASPPCGRPQAGTGIARLFGSGVGSQPSEFHGHGPQSSPCPRPTRSGSWSPSPCTDAQIPEPHCLSVALWGSLGARLAWNADCGEPWPCPIKKLSCLSS